MRRRLLREEDGFTLPEVLVSMVVMATVLFALYAVFDASIRVFSVGRDRLEAVENARLGLAMMERDLRAAYPPDRANGNTTLLASFGDEHVTFYTDLNGNRRTIKLSTGEPEDKERITYRVNDSGMPFRNNTRLTEFAQDIDGDGRAMTFEYFDANGDPVVSGEETDVALVRVGLEIVVDRMAGHGPVEQVLQTSVALRNR